MHHFTIFFWWQFVDLVRFGHFLLFSICGWYKSYRYSKYTNLNTSLCHNKTINYTCLSALKVVVNILWTLLHIKCLIFIWKSQYLYIVLPLKLCPHFCSPIMLYFSMPVFPKVRSVVDPCRPKNCDGGLLIQIIHAILKNFQWFTY